MTRIPSNLPPQRKEDAKPGQAQSAQAKPERSLAGLVHGFSALLRQEANKATPLSKRTGTYHNKK
jgi:hypothetical protein